MYKHYILAGFFVVLSLPGAFASGHNNTVVTLPGGELNFIGDVIDAACLVDIDSRKQEIRLDQVNNAQFTASGSSVSAAPFSIQLNNCSVTTSQSVGISFIGVADERDPTILATITERNMANGVGIALFDADNNLLPINAPPKDFSLLSRGTNTLHFFAKYRSTLPVVTSGSSNAAANFMVTYQ
ncbi:fimbrial protein [Yersinia mollaretii]|uniref:fimbrial protein n=1 Tax=Yersinia mollaretii TaxID=33060 RepID=UPI0025AB3740|nr:fimbrial protein [Yersinia mollaretii]MDN0111406.1 fimbrial protein [Yersinia mollaretii]